MHYATAPDLRQRSTSYHANLTAHLIERRPPAVVGVAIDDSQSGASQCITNRLLTALTVL